MHAGICAFAVGHNDATTYSSCAAATADAGARSKVARHGDASLLGKNRRLTTDEPVKFEK